MTEGRRERRRAEMRARLLTVALELFAEHGYDGTTIDQIAERADVARQTVLNHFPQKGDLVRAWGQRRRDRLTDLATEDRVGRDGSVRERLHRFYAALAGANEDERTVTRVLHQHAQLFDARRPVPDAVLDALRRGRSRGETSPDADPVAAAEVLTAVYFDTLTRWLADAEAPFDLATVLADRIDIVLDGVAAR